MRERGFTVVEVMVAMLILVVGVLGTLTMVQTASTQTRNTKAREGATNLARDLVENARVVAYERLTPAGVTGALQSRPNLADADTTTAGAWTIERRGVTYTVTAAACTYDDAKDNVASTPPAGACASSPTAVQPPPARQESKPDDFRRVDFTIAWPASSGSGRVRQSALIINPSGGLGPRVNTFVSTPTNMTQVTFNAANAGTKLFFRATTAAAAAVRWTANDGVSGGDGTPATGNTAWTFEWDLKGVGTAGAVVDGSYEVLAQAFNDLGIAGDQRTVSVRVDRSAPAAPTGLTGGRNARIDSAVPPKGPIVDLRWSPSQERDVVGYRVYRTVAASPDVLVCDIDDPLRTFCYDDAPPAGTAEYSVVAVDLDTTDSDDEREGARSTAMSVPPTSNARPYFQADDLDELELDIVDGRVQLQWDAARDDDGTVAFYRIYRDGLTFADHRHGRTDASAPSYVESEAATATSHTYWVTAVDNQFNESEPLDSRSSP